MDAAKSDTQPDTPRRAGEFPPAPPRLPVPVVDSHTHLDITVTEPGAPPETGLIDAATAVGVDRLVQVGVDVDSSHWGVKLAAAHPAVVATVAIHPNEAPRLPAPDLDDALREIEALAAQPRVRGIGETGLDRFRTGDQGRAAQEASFRAHIAIAKRYGKALVIHDRDAHADVLRVLDEEGAPPTVVMHCFSGDAEFAAECVRRGFVLSFAGTVTFKNASPLREAARLTPLDQILVETDAPYLTPMPYRGRPNASYLIPLTVRALAETTGADLADLCSAISATGERIFGPWHLGSGEPGGWRGHG
jgi:TatD DNase family protein